MLRDVRLSTRRASRTYHRSVHCSGLGHIQQLSGRGTSLNQEDICSPQPDSGGGMQPPEKWNEKPATDGPGEADRERLGDQEGRDDLPFRPGEQDGEPQQGKHQDRQFAGAVRAELLQDSERDEKDGLEGMGGHPLPGPGSAELGPLFRCCEGIVGGQVEAVEEAGLVEIEPHAGPSERLVTVRGGELLASLGAERHQRVEHQTVSDPPRTAQDQG